MSCGNTSIRGISGDATEKRKAFQKMIADADRGEFSAILCWDQDRFGRFDSIEAGRWIYPLRQHDVKLVTVAQGEVDWTSFAGRLIYNVTQEGKHAYLRDLSRNSCVASWRRRAWRMAGHTALRRTASRTSGWCWATRRKSEAVRRIFRWYLDGHSCGRLPSVERRGIPDAHGSRGEACCANC